MSYAKAIKHSSNHCKDKQRQPVLGMPFEGLKEGQHIESYYSVAKRTAESYHVRVENDNKEFIRVSPDFDTEDDAIDWLRENLNRDDQLFSRIYTQAEMYVSGW